MRAPNPYTYYDVRVTEASPSCKLNKITAIKAWRSATNAGLKEAKEAVEQVYEGYYQELNITGQGIQELRNAGFTVVTEESVIPNNIDNAVKTFIKTLVDLGALEEVKNFLAWYQMGGLTNSTGGRRLET